MLMLTHHNVQLVCTPDNMFTLKLLLGSMLQIKIPLQAVQTLEDTSVSDNTSSEHLMTTGVHDHDAFTIKYT